MNPQSQFSMGSESKLPTVLMIGLALEKSKSGYPKGWKTTICEIIPDWCLLHQHVQYRVHDTDTLLDLERTAKSATIEDLMSHQTGWPRHDYSYPYHDFPTLVTSHVPNLKRFARFREKYQYTNIMYMVLERLPSIILKTDEPFSALATRYIFQPLGMQHTTYRYSLATKIADGFTREVGLLNDTPQDDAWKAYTCGEIRVPPFWNRRESELMSGSDGLIMSVEDAATWIKFLLLKGKNPTTGVQVIPASVVEKVQTPLVTKYPGPYPEMGIFKYGGAQHLSSYRGHSFSTHGGIITGFAVETMRFPSDGFGIAVFTNDETVGESIRHTIKYNIVDRVLEMEAIDWNSRMKASASRRYLRRFKSTPRPLDSLLLQPLAELEGTYRNPSYGTVQLCSVPTTLSSTCKFLVSSLDSILPEAFSDSRTIPTLVFVHDGNWASHVRMQHFQGNVWNVTFFQSEVYSNGTTFAAPAARAEATFNFSDSSSVHRGELDKDIKGSHRNPIGFGLRGIWGQGGPLPEHGDVATRSEVWYDRM
ncbi:beta-lactamase/transpeptidase-like protein [Flagelloscypha sp. PMI_526]|nr:beta-lactamase/transpeptidase-like protein [Flagelloscypha sp. PMI_526]